MKDKRLLVISLYYAPEPTGNAPYVTQTAEHLVSGGWEVTVLAGMPHYPNWRVQGSHRRRLRTRERINGVVVQRYRNYVPSDPTVLRRLAYEATFLANVSSSKIPPVDAILAVIPALSDGVLAATLASRRGIPYGILFQDLMGPGAIESGVTTVRSIGSSIGRLEGRLARGASRVGVVSQGFVRPLVSFGVHEEDITYLPNWNLSPPPKRSALETRRSMGWRDEETIAMHAGNMGAKQGLENVVTAGALAQRRDTRLRIVLLGEGSMRRGLEQLAQRIPTIEFVDPQSPERFADMLGAADILLINERVGVKDMSMPSKLTSYLGAGRPIVAAVHPEGATAAAVRDTGAGIVVPSGQPEALLDAVTQLADDAAAREQMGLAGSNYATTHLGSKDALSRIERFVDAIAKGKGR